MRLGFSGDIAFSVVRDGESFDCESVLRQCRELTDQVDLAIGNFEGVIIPDGFQSDRKMSVTASECGAIDRSGFDVLSVANNHIMDCGQTGLDFTLEYLRAAGISTMGGGVNRSEADACLFVESQGKRLAFLAVTDASHYGAGRTRSGVSSLRNRDIVERVARASQNADLVVVSIHSDLEFTNRPAPWKVRLSRRLVREGAHIVIHHHPHTLQGIEYYKDCLIAYSLGNFIFPVHGAEYMKDRDGCVDEGMFLAVDINWDNNGNKKIKYDAIPVIIDSANRTRVAAGEKRQQILDKLEQYGRYLSEPSALRQTYFRACVQETKRFLLGTYYATQKDGLRSAMEYIHIHIRTRMHRNWMRGLFTIGHR
jgi:poly-gamma-glutamate synthesis protein (capsule biosynthesis protein)